MTKKKTTKKKDTEKKEPRTYRDGQMAVMLEKGYVTVTRAREIAHVSKSTMYRWLDDNQVVHKRVGVARYILLSSLKKCLGELVVDGKKAKE